MKEIFTTPSSGEMSDARLGELESLASKSVWGGLIIGVLGGPLGYVYVGQWRWAVINFLTLNYLLLGILIVPFHVVSMITGARTKVRKARSDGKDLEEPPVSSEFWQALGKRYANWRD